MNQDRKILKSYRNIVLLLLLAFLLYAGVFPKSDLPYWVHWLGGVIIPGALVVFAVYLLPKRPWQDG